MHERLHYVMVGTTAVGPQAGKAGTENPGVQVIICWGLIADRALFKSVPINGTYPYLLT
jgi:hypothetical protein